MALSLGILFGIITMLSWGFSDFFAAKASRKVGVAKTVLWSQTIGIIAFLTIFALFFSLPKISGYELALMLACGLLGAIGITSLYKGFEVGAISIISPIASASAVVTVVLSLIFLGEKLSYFQGIGITSAIVGAILASFKFHDIARLNFSKIASGVEYGIIAMFSFGVSFVLIDVLIEKFGWFIPVFFIKIFGLIFIVLFSFFMKKDLRFPKNVRKFVMIIAALETMAFLSIGAGISMEYTSIVYSVASSFPAITIILAAIFLKERMELSNIIGAGFVVLGIAMLSV